MIVAELLRNTKQTLFSFELLPPLKGDNISAIYDTINPLMDFSPSYINVTYHREELVYKQRPDGLLEPRKVRKRPGTVGITAAIMHKYKVEVVPHMICAGFNREETENALIDLHFIGADNILVLRGDADKNSRRFESEPDGHEHALGLLQQVMKMNKGKYLDEDMLYQTPTRFSAGVAGYPEKHAEAPNLGSDLQWLKAKVDAGAEYIVTQMFFDNAVFISFVKRCREAGINVPIVPGLKPVSIKNHLTILPGTFHVDIPEALAREVMAAPDNRAVRQIGIEWTELQARELKAAGVPSIHFYTMGKSDNIYEIVKRVF
ncbi:MAG: methylenetetrahydrofolate reductase [NAD(P)H] [Bacteroidetes bacterium HGW-Bacteroidetes-6]|jgi:methylenetetrahydrofolate reductase (NADPH)|nr:MAG: methylenetetrahydrofolate reductase [NAD(P)H] [Bacteroidetes bacterium HGW-Bacteroidetes-6]